MAEKRMISSEIFEDEFFIELDVTSRLLWIGLIVKMADDQGRFYANPKLIKSYVFPVDDIDVRKIQSSLDYFEKCGKILNYEAGGKQLFQIVTWWKHQNHQWPSPSKYPAPDGWTDRIKHHVAGNKVEKLNWEKSGGFNSVPTDVPTDVPTQPENKESTSNQQGKLQLYDDGNGDGNGENLYCSPKLEIPEISEPVAKQIKPKKEIPKKEYGEFNNVRLTDEEVEKLRNLFPDLWHEWIEKLSCWKKASNKRTASDYATIRNWARREAAEKPPEKKEKRD